MNQYLINDACIFNEVSQELSLKDKAKIIKLTAMRSRCLSLMIENADSNVIDKKTITEALWGERGQFVSDANLTQLLYLIRKDLRDVGLPDFFSTVPRVGIRVNNTIPVSKLTFTATVQNPLKRFSFSRAIAAVFGLATVLAAIDLAHISHLI
ncbi:hypothetical protein EGM70_00885 [Enterobacteriaceae bacterium 89]|nr:hypothetical protein [Enterobacteriaceae bacterium 89]